MGDNEMPIIKVEKNENYTVMSNYHLEDRNLSLKAKGLMSFVLSLPDDWDYSIKGLCSMLKEGKDAIASVLNELEKYEYLERRKTRDKDGKYDKVEYYFYEIPKPEYTKTGKPNAENPNTVTPPQLNTNINNIYNIEAENGISDSGDKKELEENFELIWKEYPRKDGKARAFEGYKQWLRGKKIGTKRIKLDNYEMWEATKKYAELVEKEKREEKYIKMGSTFFTSTILDYIEEN